MDQDEPIRRRRRSGLVAGVLVAGAFGAFAVGAVASGGDAAGDAGRATQSAPVPSFVQDEGAPDRDGRDCPWRDGERPDAPQGGAAPEGGAAPDTGVQL